MILQPWGRMEALSPLILMAAWGVLRCFSATRGAGSGVVALLQMVEARIACTSFRCNARSSSSKRGYTSCLVPQHGGTNWSGNQWTNILMQLPQIIEEKKTTVIHQPTAFPPTVFAKHQFGVISSVRGPCLIRALPQIPLLLRPCFPVAEQHRIRRSDPP